MTIILIGLMPRGQKGYSTSEDENLATGGWVRPNSVEISGRHKK